MGGSLQLIRPDRDCVIFARRESDSISDGNVKLPRSFLSSREEERKEKDDIPARKYSDRSVTSPPGLF